MMNKHFKYEEISNIFKTLTIFYRFEQLFIDLSNFLKALTTFLDFRGGMPPMKTIIKCTYKGFKGHRTRFASEILRFLNDFCDFLPLFP